MSAPIPDPQTLGARLEAAQAIAHEAGQLLLERQKNLHHYDLKSSINLVSVADRDSEALIATRLRALFPSDVLVLEERDGIDAARKQKQQIEAADFAWCVDPLDGTTSFVHRYPAFSVSLGLLAHGRPVLGVVFAPARGETFIGGQGVAATLNGAAIQVSSTATLARALLGTGFPYDRRERIDDVLKPVKRALMRAQDLRRSGSAAIDLCDVAAGRLDGFWEPGLAPWDLAAGRAIIEAAGGRLSSCDGSAHDLFGLDTLASNGVIHHELLLMLGP